MSAQPDRIASISQPYIRPIDRGKAKSHTEFGPKPDKTTRNSIALSFIAMNADRILSTFLSQFLTLIFSRYIQLKNTLKFMRNNIILDWLVVEHSLMKHFTKKVVWKSCMVVWKVVWKSYKFTYKVVWKNWYFIEKVS